MPIRLRTLKDGSKYYQYGNSGEKYYFDPKDLKSQQLAYAKALRQTRAIHVRKGFKY